MSDKSKEDNLRDMITNVIDDNKAEMKVDFHRYLNQKMSEIIKKDKSDKK